MTKRDLKPKTRAGYESILRVHLYPTFGRSALGKIKRLDVERWVSEQVASGTPRGTTS